MNADEPCSFAQWLMQRAGLLFRSQPPPCSIWFSLCICIIHYRWLELKSPSWLATCSKTKKNWVFISVNLVFLSYHLRSVSCAARWCVCVVSLGRHSWDLTCSGTLTLLFLVLSITKVVQQIEFQGLSNVGMFRSFALRLKRMHSSIWGHWMKRYFKDHFGKS